MRHSKPRSQASAILQKERFLLDEFQTVNFKISTSVHDNNMRWTPPMILWFKLNVDGATFAHLDSGFWAIIRDHASRVEADLSVHFAAPLGPLETNAKAMEEGVLFAWDVGIRDFVVESDLMIVIDALMGSNDPLTVN